VRSGLNNSTQASTDRQFYIAATNYMTAVVLPHFLRAISTLAPQASVTVLPAIRIELTAQIDVGRVEIALGSLSSVPSRLREQVQFEERDVMIVATDHSLPTAKSDWRTFSSLPLLVVSIGGSEDGLLSERGLTRRTEMFDRTALIAAFNSIGKRPKFKILQPHFLAIPHLLTNTEAAAIVPATLAEVFRQAGTAYSSELSWHARPRAVQMVGMSGIFMILATNGCA
jgi:DNA-binding transcriptional LysR family regulator